MLGPNWPDDGEIDIIEGINDNTNNAMTLHTSDGCSITNDTSFSGTMVYSDCYIYAADQPSNAGCSIENQNTSSYGKSFNSIGGGVIATEWTSSAINIWWFPRGTTPSDLTAGNPDPASWSEPVAQYQGGCNIPTYFADLQFVNFPLPSHHGNRNPACPFPPHTLSMKPTRNKLKPHPRSSTQTSAATGPEINGPPALTAHPSPIPAMTTCRKTRLLSRTPTGRSTV